MFTSHSMPYQTLSLGDKKIAVKRLDLVHSAISGNKFYKLKYNLIKAKEQGYTQILSFGGAYSNHIFALAQACHQYGFDSIGIIRGQELANKPLNHTLQTAQNLGMKLEFISREAYRNKHKQDFLYNLQAKYPNAYIIPEGGTNELAIKGCEEILTHDDKQNYDIIALAVGTGGTIAGIINSADEHQQVLGFSALNSDYQCEDITRYTQGTIKGKIKGKTNWQLIKDDTKQGFGGYGKYNDELLQFITQIKQSANIPLEPIYTGKAMYRLAKMMEQGLIAKDKKILFLHTGGLQAFKGL